MNLKQGNEDDLEDAATVFTSVRPRLSEIACRMLSSATEAEDLVQEVWLRERRGERRAGNRRRESLS